MKGGHGGGGGGEETEGICLLTIKRSLGSPRKQAAVEQSTAAHLNTNLKCLHTRVHFTVRASPGTHAPSLGLSPERSFVC